jgi:hypothetical protein
MTTVRRLACAIIGLVGIAAASAPAHAVPAFARKYGMKCTACHEAWPVLNSFGRAFRDNGFRFNTGVDDEQLTHPAYWPVFAWAWNGYQWNETKSSTHVLNENGGVPAGLYSIGAYANLGAHISVRVFAPLAIGNGPITLTVPLPGWLRYNRFFGSSWLNLRVGSIEQDLPISGARDLTENGVGVTAWSYTIPGSVSTYSLENEVPGLQLDGHDRWSINRYSISFFSNAGAQATHHDIWSTPSVYVHLTHMFQLNRTFVRDVELGLFGSIATYFSGKDSTALRNQQRYGVDLQQWFFSDAVPLHLTETFYQGRDQAALIAGATADGVFNGYMIQADYVPTIQLTLFSRASFITTQQHAVVTQTGAYGNSNIFLLGFKYTYQVTTRFEVAVEPSFGLVVQPYQAPDHTQLKTMQAYFPLEVVF